MFVLVILAVYMTGNPEKPLLGITEPKVEYFQSEAACIASARKKVERFASGLPTPPEYFTLRCVEITGMAGDPA